MATNSSQETIFGAGFSPLRGEPTMGSVPIPNVTVSTIATASAVTFTITQLLGGLILRDPAGSARADVTPTAAAIVAALPGVFANAVVTVSSTSSYQTSSSFQFDLVNTADASETITLTAGTGVTVSGTATVAQNDGKRFIVIVTNATQGSEAVTIRSLGAYTD
jgi:hypothetical protein